MKSSKATGSAQFDAHAQPPSLCIAGDWTLTHYAALEQVVAGLSGKLGESVTVNLDPLGELDTAGASLLVRLIGPERIKDLAQEAPHLPEAQRALMQTVGAAMATYKKPPRGPKTSTLSDVLARIGRTMEGLWHQQVQLLGFIGLTLETIFRTAPRPRRWRVTSLVSHIEQTGLDAVPIVALLTFMVGAVVAFLGSTVLADFGASIYTVDLVAFSFLREFGVLLTAILMAGRTASAFTAQIGSMKANEEIDAIRALGLDPMELLVVPRVLAMLVSLPLLTFLAMMAGLIGGGVVCALVLDISPVMFISLLKSDIGVRHFVVGIVKAPVFAFIIAVIGCLEGFKVSGSAQSVGEHTTSSVVQSIFVVILLDAMAALFFMEMNW
ncbi:MULTISPECIES: MlaE family ABC transporter permease [Dyella]|uniref:ABC transporter permease n=2 Tax=Dyella TaxID=231454 RepID=A0A4R0YXQ8_9GAMM|nr:MULTISPECIES: ABC transporter permease [Dyella]TBR40344.1 ABC transporter permease [Dyella terrae]TCI12074.1 ABC transporter permease [Dyella soli]